MITKKLVLASSLFLALGAAGCEKSADLGRMQDSTMELVKLHQSEIDVLQRRADALMQRGRNLVGDAAGIADAGRLLSEARSGIDQLRAQATAASASMTNAVKSGDVEEVQRQNDEVLEKLDAGEIAVRANLSAVDSWLMSVENRPVAQAATTPPPPAQTDEAPASGSPTGAEVPVAAPTGTEAGSGAAAGSAAGSGSGAAK